MARESRSKLLLQCHAINRMESTHTATPPCVCGESDSQREDSLSHNTLPKQVLSKRKRETTTIRFRHTFFLLPQQFFAPLHTIRSCFGVWCLFVCLKTCSRFVETEIQRSRASNQVQNY